MKIIIAGSRNFNDFDILKEKMDKATRLIDKDIEIVSGTARGADKLGERYAKERNHSIISMPADWDKHGRSAGYIRNEQMASLADVCVVFWNRESNGTRHMIRLAKKYNVPVLAYDLDGNEINTNNI